MTSLSEPHPPLRAAPLPLRVIQAISTFCGFVAAAMIFAAVFITCQMIWVRFVMNESTIWQTDSVIYLVIGSTLIGLPYVQRVRGHVNVDLLPIWLPMAPRRWLAILTLLAGIVVIGGMFVYGFEMWLEAYEKGWRSETVWGARLWIPYLAMPVGFGLYLLQLLADLYGVLAGVERPFGLAEEALMDPLIMGGLVGVATIAVLFSGISVATGLLIVAAGFLMASQGLNFLSLIPETFFASLNSFELLSIPMFIIMGAAIASTRAGADLYEALERWMTRVPGGLVISNLGACALFAAMSGSSPATCAAIGKMGIPEMRRRGYPDGVAAGSIAAGGTLGILIPPSVTMIVYGIATETSIGRLFLAGVVPGILLMLLFMAWALIDTVRHGNQQALERRIYSWKQRFEIMPRVLPFLLIIAGVLYAMYGGLATPSETAAVGALLCLVVAVVIYRLWQPVALWAILRDATRESVMILFIIAAAGVFSYMLSSLFITQSIAQWIGTLDVHPWVLMFFINLFLLVAGFFLPPVAVILMSAPILLPIIVAAGFDPYWFAVILTINMEIGLITPPVGLNLYVINGIAPDISLKTILWGSLPFVLCMVLGIVLLSFFPWLATGLPDLVMGKAI
ncbi:MAG: TRAP transporter large permease subunit [Burkholderiaceae bacterium]